VILEKVETARGLNGVAHGLTHKEWLAGSGHLESKGIPLSPCIAPGILLNAPFPKQCKIYSHTRFFLCTDNFDVIMGHGQWGKIVVILLFSFALSTFH